MGLGKLSEITPALERIARDIRNGYIIGYVPPSPGTGCHAIRVTVQPPDRRKPIARSGSQGARSGYQE